jgi:hypothetical protein
MSKNDGKLRKEELEKKIDNEHDMADSGQTWSWEGCGAKGFEVCTICGLRHRWGRDGQNTGSYDEYLSASGETITLGQAARLKCE